MEKIVRTKINLYLRDEPKRSAKGVLVPVGTILECIESVKGELVEGIDDWYKEQKGLYFWAGGVEKIENEEVKFIWPLKKSYKRITTPFSETWIKNSKKNHTGIDIAVPVGEEVFAVADGIVKKIGYLDNEKKMAQYVDVGHDLENYCTAYLHINPAVKIGDKLKAGNVVGHIAQLIEMGPHLHFNVWEGAYNNPITHRGALPKVEYSSEFTDLVFPSNFIDPKVFVYRHVDDIKNI